MKHQDTIYALSSGYPPAAIAVVRLSGPRAGAGLEQLIGRLPAPRRASLGRVRDPASGEVLDEALTLWLPGPNTETGEDMAEIHVHGGRAVIFAVLTALGHVPGLRMAEPGEFTRRAFENGRIDLTAVEGLADLIFADTEAQRRQAFRQLKGQLGEQAERWRTRLIEALAQVEAGIDFSDEADVPANLVGPAVEAVRILHDEIRTALADERRGERLREGFTVAIAGPPNAGKSSLLNRIARREAAIVSPYAGTTRDVIEVHLDLDGYPVTLLDTAGIRESDDPVEREGVSRARARAAAADLVLWVSEEGGPEAAPPGAATVWMVHNKADLAAGLAPGKGRVENTPNGRHFATSAKTGEGVDALIGALAGFARNSLSGEGVLVTRARQREALEATAAALGRALEEGVRGREDVLAEELRAAATALGRLTGRVDVEDVLDVIFRDFCIGK